jgi:hypothetical protein
MPTNNTERLTERYKAAIAAFNRDESSYESRQELKNLRWEERLPLVYRLRARAALTGDFIIGCCREREEGEHYLLAEQQACTEISAGVSSSTASGLEVEDRESETPRQPADAEQQSRDDSPGCATKRDVVRGSLGLFAGFGSAAAEPRTKAERRKAKVHVLR